MDDISTAVQNFASSAPAAQPIDPIKAAVLSVSGETTDVPMGDGSFRPMTYDQWDQYRKQWWISRPTQRLPLPLQSFNGRPALPPNEDPTVVAKARQDWQTINAPVQPEDVGGVEMNGAGGGYNGQPVPQQVMGTASQLGRAAYAANPGAAQEQQAAQQTAAADISSQNGGTAIPSAAEAAKMFTANPQNYIMGMLPYLAQTAQHNIDFRHQTGTNPSGTNEQQDQAVVQANEFRQAGKAIDASWWPALTTAAMHFLNAASFGTGGMAGNNPGYNEALAAGQNQNPASAISGTLAGYMMPGGAGSGFSRVAGATVSEPLARAALGTAEQQAARAGSSQLLRQGLAGAAASGAEMPLFAAGQQLAQTGNWKEALQNLDPTEKSFWQNVAAGAALGATGRVVGHALSRSTLISAIAADPAFMQKLVAIDPSADDLAVVGRATKFWQGIQNGQNPSGAAAAAGFTTGDFAKMGEIGQRLKAVSPDDVNAAQTGAQPTTGQEVSGTPGNDGQQMVAVKPPEEPTLGQQPQPQQGQGVTQIYSSAPGSPQETGQQYVDRVMAPLDQLAQSEATKMQARQAAAAAEQAPGKEFVPRKFRRQGDPLADRRNAQVNPPEPQVTPVSGGQAPIPIGSNRTAPETPPAPVAQEPSPMPQAQPAARPAVAPAQLSLPDAISALESQLPGLKGKARAAVQDKIEMIRKFASAPPPAPSAPAQASAPPMEKSAPFTKADIEDRLQRAYNEQNGIHEQAAVEHKATEASGGNATTFLGQLPGEVKTFLQGRFHLRKKFKVTQDASQAGGEDAMQSMGQDAYFNMIERGGTKPDLVAWGKNHPDPNVQLLAALHENMGRVVRKDLQVVDPSSLPTGTTFSLHGSNFEIVEDPDSEDGHRLLKDGKDYPVLPADMISTMPADRGSVQGPDTSVPFAQGLKEDHPVEANSVTEPAKEYSFQLAEPSPRQKEIGGKLEKLLGIKVQWVQNSESHAYFPRDESGPGIAIIDVSEGDPEGAIVHEWMHEVANEHPDSWKVFLDAIPEKLKAQYSQMSREDLLPMYGEQGIIDYYASNAPGEPNVLEQEITSHAMEDAIRGRNGLGPPAQQLIRAVRGEPPVKSVAKVDTGVFGQPEYRPNVMKGPQPTMFDMSKPEEENALAGESAGIQKALKHLQPKDTRDMFAKAADDFLSDLDKNCP